MELLEDIEMKAAEKMDALEGHEQSKIGVNKKAKVVKGILDSEIFRRGSSAAYRARSYSFALCTPGGSGNVI